MKTQHTPGPWKIQTATHSGPHIMNEKNFQVAEIVNTHFKESEANAQLIASAPDLLEALKSATNKSYQFGVTPYTDDLGNRWVKYEQRISEADYNKIHSTIAKAEKS